MRLFVALALTALSRTLPAQQPGRLEGLVRGARTQQVVVELTRVSPEPLVTLATRTDSRGAFRFDSLVPGDYALHVSTPALDSLDLALGDRGVAITSGKRTKVELALPSGLALREALCPGVELDKGRGVVAGRATDATSEQPLGGATVVVAWNELEVDRATLKTRTEERVGSVETDPRGEYRLCGVPTGASLSIQVQMGSSSSAIVQAVVAEEVGAVRRDLSLVVDSTVAASEPDSSAGAAAPSPAGRIGLRAPSAPSASVAGTVRGAAGQPLSGVELRIDGTNLSAVSDENGRYALSGLPAGTRMLVVRRLGYEAVTVPVELRAGRRIDRDVALTRVISLDSIRVVAMRSRFPEFEYNRKANPFGYYLVPDELERRKGAFVSDKLYGIPGVSIVGHGTQAAAVSVHGRGGASKCGGMRVVVNGTQQGFALNDVPASQVVAIEIYPQGAFAPTQYSVRGSCGVIVLWTREAARTVPAPGASSATPGTSP